MNAITIPEVNVIRKEYIQYIELDFNNMLVIVNSVIKDRTLIQKVTPNFKSNILKGIDFSSYGTSESGHCGDWQREQYEIWPNKIKKSLN